MLLRLRKKQVKEFEFVHSFSFHPEVKAFVTLSLQCGCKSLQLRVSVLSTSHCLWIYYEKY